MIHVSLTWDALERDLAGKSGSPVGALSKGSAASVPLCESARVLPE